MNHPSRLEHAHRRLRVTRYAIGVAAAGIFAAGAVVVRSAHPAGHSAKSGSTQASESSSSDTTNDGLTGSDTTNSGSYLSPATSAPVIESSGS